MHNIGENVVRIEAQALKDLADRLAGAMAEDFEISGIEGLLVQNHRVVAFDRPGFGFSSRPRTRIWTAQAQAALLDKALLRLGIERAVIVGHSWGTLVAIALALHNPQRVAGLVLIAGYYFPSIRTDVALTSWPAMPVFGDVLRYTISPILARIAAPSVKRKLFAPAKVPLRFERDFSVELAVRPSQIRASAVETALMIPTTANLSARYAELRMPVTLIAAKGDQIVNFDRQTLRLSRNIEGSTLHLIPEAGHMVHHTAPQEVAALIKDAAKVSVGSSDPAHFH